MKKYDAFEHLYRSLFAKPNDLFIMLTAYLDDSGTDASTSAVAVAGYLATTHQWEGFNQRWATLLKNYGVTKMRRADLENFQGEFKEWDPQRRTEFVIKAQSIIRKYTYTGIGQVLVKKDFAERIPDRVSSLMGGPYGFCGYHCMRSVGEWCDSRKYNGKVHYVFEAGTEGSVELNRMLDALYKRSPLHEDKLRLSGWSFEGKETVPLQSADVIAYEMLKVGENHIVTKGRKTRRSLITLFRERDRYHTHYWKPEDLTRWTEALAKRASEAI